MKAFRLILASAAVIIAAASCQSPEGPAEDTGAVTSAEESDADADGDTDSDADSDADTDADGDIEGFSPVTGDWREVGTETYQPLDASGFELAGIGSLEKNSEGDTFPIKFSAPEVVGEGEFTDAYSAFVKFGNLTVYFERRK